MGLIFLSSLAFLQRGRALRGQNDFVALYTGAKLAGTPDLYSRPANLRMVHSILGFNMDSVVYTRPPFYAAFLKPLAFLPYEVAYGVFSLLMLSGMLWFVLRFSRECLDLPLLAAMSIPLIGSLCGGQDTPILLVVVGLSLLLTRKGKDFAAGLVLSLCAIKFHLFLFLPLLLLVKGRWRILRGAACGTAALFATGLLVAGPDSVRQYMAVLRDPWINPSAAGMPNLHGLVAALNGGPDLEAALIVAVAGAFVWLLRSAAGYEFLFAAAIVCGLLVSFHSSVADDVLLLPVFVSVVATSSSPALRVTSALLLTPVPYFTLFASPPYSALLPLSLLLLCGLFCLAVPAKPQTVPLPALPCEVNR